MRRVLAPIAYMGLIFILSSIPGNSSDPDTLLEQSLIWITPNLQNLLHIPLFFGLALTWIYSLNNIIKNHLLVLVTASFLSTVYGLLDEIHQTQIPGRYGSISDLALDTLGAILIFTIPLIKILHLKSYKRKLLLPPSL